MCFIDGYSKTVWTRYESVAVCFIDCTRQICNNKSIIRYTGGIYAIYSNM